MSGPVTVALRRIEDLFAVPARWQQGSYGDPGQPHCIIGAALDPTVVPTEVSTSVEDLLRSTAHALYEEGAVYVNDHFGLDAVRLVVATALDVAEAEGL